jgi:hypothetical protein
MIEGVVLGGGMVDIAFFLEVVSMATMIVGGVCLMEVALISVVVAVGGCLVVAVEVWGRF